MKIDTKRIVLIVLVILAITLVISIQLLVHNIIHILPSRQTQENDADVVLDPPSIGTDILPIYFGQDPVEVQDKLICLVQLLRFGTIDLDESTITLPLYECKMYEKNAQKVAYSYWNYR